MDLAIQIKDLTKKYGELTAVDSLNFDVEKGSVFGVVGPDGAGKTTLIRMLCGLIEPDSGSASILNLDMVKDKK